MNTLVIYYSKYGNTQKVAETIAGECKANGDVRVLSLDDLTAADLQGVELVVMGCPTHRMNLPERVRAGLAGWPKRSLRGRSVAAFDTSYKMSAWLRPFTASKRLARKLGKLGGRRVVPPETFHVMGAEGPLFEGELERARTWAGLVLGKAGHK